MFDDLSEPESYIGCRNKQPRWTAWLRSWIRVSFSPPFVLGYEVLSLDPPRFFQPCLFRFEVTLGKQSLLQFDLGRNHDNAHVLMRTKSQLACQRSPMDFEIATDWLYNEIGRRTHVVKKKPPTESVIFLHKCHIWRARHKPRIWCHRCRPDIIAASHHDKWSGEGLLCRCPLCRSLLRLHFWEPFAKDLPLIVVNNLHSRFMMLTVFRTES